MLLRLEELFNFYFKGFIFLDLLKLPKKKLRNQWRTILK